MSLERPSESRARILGDDVYSVLGAAIRDGTLAPGQRVRDTDLARALGVSRTPVREALQRLERNGMIEVAANRYTRVSQPSAQEKEDTREFVVCAFAAALRMAAHRATEEELARALTLLDDVIAVAADDDTAELVSRGFRFYFALTPMTHNAVFVRMIAEASLSFQRNLEGWRPHITDPAARRETYVRLRHAFAMRQGAAAERIMRVQHGYE